ncbi:hypothetical protein E4U45_004610 [Claviceps purpurea]|nr:hypothetical protein E4U45_004610 [Claviceps purpurea]
MEEVKEAMEAVEKWKSCKKVNDGESWKVPELHLTTESAQEAAYAQALDEIKPSAARK